MSKLKNICVYCGSSIGSRQLYRDHARQLGKAIAESGFRLVYGGGHIGLMGVVADAVLASGGQAIGVIPQYLADKEVAHRGLTELHIVGTMHQRKQTMADLADAFIALPGGYGTLDELCEVLGWAQLGLHSKPIILYDASDYWQPLFEMFDRAVEHGFLKQENRNYAMRARSIAEIFTILRELESPELSSRP